MPDYRFPPTTGVAPFVPPGVMATPDRVLFVSPVWPGGADPAVFFNTIEDALTQAATMVPSSVDPILVVVYPGIYPENLTLISSVSLFSFNRAEVSITGTVSWTAGAGVNAPQIADFEICSIRNMILGGNVTADTSAKTGDQGVLNIEQCVLDGSVALTGGAGAQGILTILNNFTNNTITVDTAILLAISNFVGADISLIGAQAFILGGQVGATVSLDASIMLGSSLFGGPVGGINGSAILANAGSFQSTVTVDATSSADIRGAEYPGGAGALIGPGTIDRNNMQVTVGPTIAGANPFTFAGLGTADYPAGNYTVLLTCTTAPDALGIPSVSGKLGTGFTVDEPPGVAGRSYDAVLMRT